MKLLATLALLCATSLHAQRATGVAPGVDTTLASLTVTIAPAQVIQQALTVHVIFGPPLKVEMWKGARIVNGVRVGVPLDSVLVGESGCIYTTASDRLGNQVTGLGPITITSSNPAVLSIAPATSPCPTTTVRFADMPIVP